mgnify:CR=1 FL=1
MFTPHKTEKVHIPYFEDSTKGEGWAGYSTTKSAKTLRAEIIVALARLGGIVSTFQRGTFQVDGLERQGVRIHYSLENPAGLTVPGRLDIAALPCRRPYRNDDKSFCMALYMLRAGLEGMWYMERLSPGYASLVPWMLGPGDKTISELWAASPIMSRLLPPGESEFIEGEIIKEKST